MVSSSTAGSSRLAYQMSCSVVGTVTSTPATSLVRYRPVYGGTIFTRLNSTSAWSVNPVTTHAFTSVTLVKSSP